jgi:putative endonuclease
MTKAASTIRNKQNTIPMQKTYNFWVYILTNPNQTTYYVGVTNNLSRRLVEHYENRGKAEIFAGKYYCYCLIWCEWHQYVWNAFAREKAIKRFTRKQKEDLIREFNPEQKFLNAEHCGTWPPKKDNETGSS